MSVKSRNVSIRLHPDDPHEARAIEILDALGKQGFSNRQIITDALLRAEGFTPEMFQQGGDGLNITFLLERIEEIITGAVKDMLSNLPAPARHQAMQEAGESDEDSYARNIAKSVMARNGGKK